MTSPRRSASRLTGLALTALVLVTGLAGAGPAAAHEEVAGVRNVLDAVTPALPAGVTAQVLVSAADQLVVENRTSTELTVLGEQGEPFLRIGPQGVLANLLSPAWHLSNDPEGARVPPEADAKKAPRWGRVSREPSWGWFDHRLHRSKLATAPAARPGEAVRLEQWSVPARYGAAAVTFRGHREYQRPAGAFASRVTQAPQGATATILPGPVPGLLVQAPGPGTVLLLGTEGEPFVRFTDRGAEVNEASPTWALTARAKTGRLPAGEVGSKTMPRWTVQSADRSLLWLEPRARYGQELPPADVLAASQPTTVLQWQIPATVDGRQLVLRGETQWVPETSGPASALPAAVPASGQAREPGRRSTIPYVVVGGLLVVVLGLLGGLVRRRRTG